MQFAAFLPARALRATLVVLALVGNIRSVHAHEFWISATPESPRQGSGIRLQLLVGEYFRGDPVGVSTQHASAMAVYSDGGRTDLMPRLQGKPARAEITLSPPQSGALLVAYDSHPTDIALGAEKFHAYLHEEGLDSIIALRERQGTSASPARERFRRCAKSLIMAGGTTDDTVLTRTGQKIEIVPLDNPHRRLASGSVRFSLLFDGMPLAGALVKAWHHHGGETVMIRTRTDPDGRFGVSFPYTGAWMISAVHMVPAAGDKKVDWESYWASLTFSLPATNEQGKADDIGR